jgi:cardiolipin synthase
LLTVMTCQVVEAPHLVELKGVLLKAIAILAPISAAEYAWIVLRRMHTPPIQTPTAGA